MQKAATPVEGFKKTLASAQEALRARAPDACAGWLEPTVRRYGLAAQTSHVSGARRWLVNRLAAYLRPAWQPDLPAPQSLVVSPEQIRKTRSRSCSATGKPSSPHVASGSASSGNGGRSVAPLGSSITTQQTNGKSERIHF